MYRTKQFIIFAAILLFVAINIRDNSGIMYYANELFDCVKRKMNIGVEIHLRV